MIKLLYMISFIVFFISSPFCLAFEFPLSIACGDVQNDEAVIWVRGNFPASVSIEYPDNKLFNKAKKVNDLTITEVSDYTGKITLRGLLPDKMVFYRAYFKNLKSPYNIEGPILGACKSANNTLSPIKFLWSSGIGTDGFGINNAWGGMKIFRTMMNRQADFTIFAGNVIYADTPLEASKSIDNSRIWHNVITSEKQKVAEQIYDFWGHYKYNLLDNNFRNLIANTTIYSIWNDRAFYNNWYPDEIINDARYKENNVNVLVANGKKAFFDYMPIAENRYAPDRIYRNINYGPLLEFFLLDVRSYRGSSNENTQEQKNAYTSLLGVDQLNWLKNSLLESKALWKIIVISQPISFIIKDGRAAFDGIANIDGAPRGKEIEFSELLFALKQNDIKNILFLSGGVNFTAALYYDPTISKVKNFNPFYEFVAGPLNGATEGLKKLDDTFAPKLLFSRAAENSAHKLSPLEGFQFFGEVNIHRDGKLSVSFRDLVGKELYVETIEAQ
jgi:alkaline phosphatase D